MKSGDTFEINHSNSV